jgi:N-methylhydantoinase B
MEVQFPFIYLQGEYVSDTAAPGKWRGSPAYWVQRASTTDAVVNNIYVQGCEHPLQGYAGGKPGAGNYCILDYKGSNERPVQDVVFGYVQKPGEILFAQSGGGGGWGDPLDRDPAMVLRDVLDEYVSLEGARREYGVVIDPATLTVDETATQKLRAELRNATGK